MQKAGDCTQESEFIRPNGGGVAQWFPGGFHTQGVDWTGLEEHLLTVPDFAFQTTTGSGGICHANGEKSIPKGVCALHLAVSCCNPPAPLSLIHRLINVNPDALHLRESQFGWNVLHCALKFNNSMEVDGDNLIDTLLEARPDLVCDGATSIDEYGLTPVAYAQCPRIVTKLVRLMPPKLAASILKKIFKRRKLLGGTAEAMAQLIREISLVELRQNRSILASAIVPENWAAKGSPIKYVLLQTSKCGRNTKERSDLKHLIEPIIQATYCFQLVTSGKIDVQELDNMPHPPAVECLKALLSEKKVGPKVLKLYSSVMNDNAEYSENFELLEPNLAAVFSDTASSLRMDSDTSGQSTDSPIQDPCLHLENAISNNPNIRRLIQCKDELDSKVAASLEALRQAVVVLENYRASYSSTINRLCDEVASRPSAQTGVATHTNSFSRSPDSINWDSLRTATASDHGDPQQLAQSPSSQVAIEDTIENLKAAASGLEDYAKKVTFDSENLVAQQEDLETVDMKVFQNSLHHQAVQAVASITDHQIEKNSIQKCLDEIKVQLKENESLGDKEARIARRKELEGRCATLKAELRDMTRKIEELQEVVTARRQEVGQYMIKARRLLHKKGLGAASRVVRQKANRLLREAKKEMRALMATLVEISPNFKSFSRHRKKKWKQLHQRDVQLVEQQRRAEEDEELTRMTKRMRL